MCAALYGRLQGRGKQKTATATHEITATLETWDVKVVVTMYPSGVFVVETGEKYGIPEFAFKGDANEESR